MLLEDAHVPLETDDLDTEQLADRPFELSLLQSLDLTSRWLRPHDVVRGYLGQQLARIH